MGKLIRVLAIVILLATAKGACADEFSFSFSTASDSASGTLTATPVSSGVFLVTSISGTIELSGTDFAMSLLPLNTYGMNDNRVYPSFPHLDTDGVGFAADSIDFNIYFDIVDLNYYLCDSTDDPVCDLGNGAKVKFGSLTPIVGGMPEPSTLQLLALGLAGLAIALGRKRTMSSAALC